MKAHRARHAGFTLVELLVVIVIIGILAALLIPAIARGIRRAKVVACASNLSQLFKMQNVYMSKYGTAKHYMPTEIGKAFWLKLTITVPPLIEPGEMDLFQCPARGEVSATECYYLGPRDNVNRLKDGEFMGCDLNDNHASEPIQTPSMEGGNILRKSGDVIEDAGPLWAQCIGGACAP